MQSGGSNTAGIPALLFLLLDDEEPVDPNVPIANAGPDNAVLVGELVELDGSGSSDPENRELSYLWSFASIPTGSTAAFDLDTSETPEFVLDVPGEYIVQLIVNNGIEDSVPDTAIITNINRAPTADAGINSIVPLNEVVQLDGSASADIDTDPLSFLWTLSAQPNGSSASLSDPQVENPQFTPDLKGTYVFDLVVNDGIVDSQIDQVEVLAGAEILLSVADTFFGVDRETTATITLDPPAPPQGLTVSLVIDEDVIGLSESELLFMADESEKVVTLTGLQVGMSELVASSPNIEDVSVDIEVSGALISIDEIPSLSPSASRSVAISLSDLAPAGGVTINLESLDTDVATVSPSTLQIPEGQFTPTQNAQITGVGLGETVLRATAVGFAPDEREIEVALAAEFDPLSLDVPETLSREIVLTLDAPAPDGGVVFDLTIIGDELFSVQPTVAIAAGETQSQPIVLSGITEGEATLRASALGFVDADAAITVVDAPNVFLSRTNSSSHLTEAVVGIDLQEAFRFRLEITPTSAIDIHASVPEDSGVLLAPNASSPGGTELVLEDVLGVSTNAFFVQGVTLGDDVPITLQAFLAGTTTPAGYEPLPSTIDIDPSGVFVNSTDFSMTTFTTNRSVVVQTGLLNDNENPTQAGTFRQSQRVRAGTELQVPMQVSNAGVVELPEGATDTLTIAANATTGSLLTTPVGNGTATVSITSQPANGFSLPSDRDDEVEITVTAPEAFLSSRTSTSHLVEALTGVDLQNSARIRLATAPPNPVDIQVSVPSGSGVLLSTDTSAVGGTQILFEDITATFTPVFSIQGVSLGDDVPITVEVFNANTQDSAGYNELMSTVDVDPSGIFVASADYSTTTFSNARAIQVNTALLFDDETPSREGERAFTLPVRGGINLDVPMQVDEPAIVSLPDGAMSSLTVSGGASSSNILATPISAGEATISIATLPGAFAIPSNNDGEVTATVSAPNAFLRRNASASHQPEAVVGIDLQTTQFIQLAQTPPAAVDIRISVPSNSGVLLSTDGTVAGGTEILFEDRTNALSPPFFIQGTQLGDDVPITIDVFEANTTTPIGYNVLQSTIDVDPSGVYLLTGNIVTTTFSNNSNVVVTAGVLFDDEDVADRDGVLFFNQAVRGGASLDVPLAVSDVAVAVLPAGANDTLTISGGSQSSSIALDPQTAGTATLSITAQPNSGFTLPTNRNGEISVTVEAPDARFNTNSILVGDEMQQSVQVTLAVAPPNPVDVTIEVTSATAALVSTDGTMAGSASVTFENISTTSVGSIFVQGLDLNAATQIRVSAPGYNDGTADVEVVDSGFRLTGTFININVGASRDFLIRAVRLNSNGTFGGNQAVRGGASFSIPVTSSLPGVGEVTTPVVLSNGASGAATTFSALSSGTTNIQITQPVGFTPPVGGTESEITVN